LKVKMKTTFKDYRMLIKVLLMVRRANKIAKCISNKMMALVNSICLNTKTKYKQIILRIEFSTQIHQILYHKISKMLKTNLLFIHNHP